MEKNKLNFHELLTGEGNQLRYVKRFSTSRVMHMENIAEHSFFTAFFSLIIGKWAISHGHIVDMGLLAQKALFHDIEEQFTGDIIRPVKYGKSGLIKRCLDETSEYFVTEFFDKIFPGNQVNSTHFILLWKNAKEFPSNEAYILRFADFCSVLSYLYQEVHGGNRLVMQSINGLVEHCKLFQNVQYNFIRELVDESYIIVNYLTEAN